MEHHHHEPGGDAAALIERAERRCGEAGRLFTPLRRRVFAELARSGSLGAYDLVERLGQERRIAPISVYRALDFLIEAGLIHRIAARNTYLPCHGDHDHDRGDATVFLVCTQCGNVDELSSATVARELQGAAAAVGFAPLSRSVEVEGECSACRTQ